jgi:UDP-glucose:(heptosyl)LPS alpha-1,3-glucosyltransferase
MKLAFCLFNYFPFGGLQRDFLRITQECLRRGHQVDIYTMEWKGARDPNLSIHILPVTQIQNHTRAQEFARQLNTLFSQKKYDKIIGFNKMPGLDIYYAADTCFQAKARAKHGLWYRLTPRYRHLAAFENAVFNKNTHTEILLLSALQQPEFQHYYQTNDKRFHLLPPGIAKDRIAPSNAHEIRTALRQELNITDNEFLLLMIGSGFKTKGLDRTLQALAQLPPQLKNHVRLFIIGQDHSAAFEKLAKKLHIDNKITFLGGRNDVSRFLLGADVLLHPAYNENTGTVLLEALVAGLPVIATEVCGYAHYIKEADAGVVLPSPFKQEQFNLILQNVLSSSEQRSRWQKNALAFAQHADIYSLPERAVDLIEQLGKHA